MKVVQPLAKETAPAKAPASAPAKPTVRTPAAGKPLPARSPPAGVERDSIARQWELEEEITTAQMQVRCGTCEPTAPREAAP